MAIDQIPAAILCRPVITVGNHTMEDVLRLLEVHRNGLCRQTLLLNHAEAQKQV